MCDDDFDDDGPMPCGENMCHCDHYGEQHGPCGCDCPRDDDEDDELEESGEWQPGECDNCLGGEPITGPLGPIYCACRIGQGAAPEGCVCGPEEG